MILLFIACAAILAAGAVVCAGIGPRRRCDVVTGSLAVSLALIALLGKVLLLAGMFRPVPVTVAAVGSAVGACSWLAVDHRAQWRAGETVRLFVPRRLSGQGRGRLSWVTAVAPPRTCHPSSISSTGSPRAWCTG